MLGPDVEDRAHCTPQLNALSYRFAVCCDDAALGAQIGRSLTSLRQAAPAYGGTTTEETDVAPAGDAPVLQRYTVTASPDQPGTVEVARDGEVVASRVAARVALDWLVWDINRLAAERSGEHLLFHAGGLEASGIGILLPGASGSGKSTLTAGLVRAGLGYLSDELVALEVDDADPGRGPGRLLPYPKPITVKRGSFGVLADMAPHAPGREGETEWQVPVGDGTGRRVGQPCEPRFVVVPRYDACAGTALVPLSETELFFTLALHAVNLLPHGTAGSEVLGRLAGQCAGYVLTFSDLDRACELVLGLVASPA